MWDTYKNKLVIVLTIKLPQDICNISRLSCFQYQDLIFWRIIIFLTDVCNWNALQTRMMFYPDGLSIFRCEWMKYIQTIDPNLIFSETLILYAHYQIYDKRFSAWRLKYLLQLATKSRWFLFILLVFLTM